jgi:membrane protease YdiL (CAAX protease family)
LIAAAAPTPQVRRGAVGWAWPCGLAALLLAVEWGRVLAVREWPLTAQLVGGAILCAAGLRLPAAALGLGRDRFPQRLLGGLALAAVLLMPAAVRWTGALPLTGWLAVSVAVVALGEEVAFRGALFAAFQRAAGGPLAVVATTLVWTLAHALSHPPAFLLAVAAAGLLLGCWRLYARDLVAPVIGHLLADLAL